MLQVDQCPNTETYQLGSYLHRMFNRINTLFLQVHIFSPRKILPEKPRIGGVYYFSAAILPDITGEGLWLYKSTGWIQLG